MAENEEDDEQRDFSRVAKVTKPVLNHSSYSCIGSSSCLKQKNIRKLFPQTLLSCESLQVGNPGPKKDENGPGTTSLIQSQ